MPQTPKQTIDLIANKKKSALMKYINSQGIEIRAFENTKNNAIDKQAIVSMQVMGHQNSIQDLSTSSTSGKIIFVNEDNSYMAQNNYTNGDYIFSSNNLLVFCNIDLKKGSKIQLTNFNNLSLVVDDIQKKDTFGKIARYKLSRFTV